MNKINKQSRLILEFIFNFGINISDKNPLNKL